MATKSQNPYQEILEIFVIDSLIPDWGLAPFTIENQAFATNGHVMVWTNKTNVVGLYKELGIEKAKVLNQISIVHAK